MELLLAHPGAFRAQLTAIAEVVGGAVARELATEPGGVAVRAPELRGVSPTRA